MSTSQTLSRGLTALELIALADHAPTIDDVAVHLAVHRSIAYRIVRTLEAHHLVQRDPSGGCTPGVRLAGLGRFARPTLRSAAVPALASLADELMMTCFLVVSDGDEALTLESLEPTTTQFHLTYRPGIRHAIDRGAPGVAILAGRSAEPDERAAVTEARRRGWAFTTGEVIDGLASIAVPVPGADASIAAVFLRDTRAHHQHIADRLAASADDIANSAQLWASTTPPCSLRRTS
jgi:DNA-binding IclR family transcriptional regulator